MDLLPDVAGAAALIAEPARAAMLMVLADGRARPAGELAFAASVTAQTASSHLAKLLAGGLLAVETEGRHRYYRLAGAHIALALEQLAAIGPPADVRRKPLTPSARHLQFARCCYNHLAGRVGVAMTQAMQQRGYLVAAPDKQFTVTPSGITWFAELGLEVQSLLPTRRGLARQCLDWTERQHHLAGPLGVQLLALLCEKGWLRRDRASRAVHVTAIGGPALWEVLGVEIDGLGRDDHVVPADDKVYAAFV